MNSAAALAPKPTGKITPRLAATLLVVRDGAEGLEVLMLRRVERTGDIASGAYVFPGGLVDAGDRQSHDLCVGMDDALASAALGLEANGLDFYIAAIRECFEEAGLLLAHHADGSMLTLDESGTAEWSELRGAVRHGTTTLRQVCGRMGLQLAPDRLTYHSYWLTPPGLPKRYDTRFFVAAAPQGQNIALDSDETLEHAWIRPIDALDPARGMKLLQATVRTLESLARFGTAADCIADAARQRVIERQMPRRAIGSKGMRFLLADDHAYAEVGYIDPDGLVNASYEIEPGKAVRLSERVLRLTAPNPGPMTGPGTNTYLVGGGVANEWAVIDPGPDHEGHVQAIMAAAPGPIRWILVTHTHRDHSPAASSLKKLTGARLGGIAALHPEWHDTNFTPDHVLTHGERVALGDATSLRVIHTPGHASNHVCYLLEEEKTLFTGDHIMQGSTVVISPPDGDMTAYLASLEMLLDEPLDWLAPGHGFLVPRPHDAVRKLVRHRLHREAKVKSALGEWGPIDIDGLVAKVYDDVPPQLHPVARRSLLAHLLKLQAEGQAVESKGLWGRSEA